MQSTLANMKKPGHAPGFFFAARLFRDAKAVSFYIGIVMAGLVPAIPLGRAPCHPLSGCPA
jgi:hypothetical protein